MTAVDDLFERRSVNEDLEAEYPLLWAGSLNADRKERIGGEPGQGDAEAARAMHELWLARTNLRDRAVGRGRHPVQVDVEAFHRALDIPVGDTPEIRRPELRAELIREEAAETVAAIIAGDLVAAIDGLCDLLCVTYGAAVEFGVNLAPFWTEVHRTNMAKKDGPTREDGKKLKPPGWTPPDIAGVLERERSAKTLLAILSESVYAPVGIAKADGMSFEDGLSRWKALFPNADEETFRQLWDAFPGHLA